MIGVSQLLSRKVGPNPSRDEVQRMLHSRAWFFVVWSCMRDMVAIESAIKNPALSPEERAFNAGRLDATERIITNLPKTIFSDKNIDMTKDEAQTETQIKEMLKELFDA